MLMCDFRVYPLKCVWLRWNVRSVRKMCYLTLHNSKPSPFLHVDCSPVHLAVDIFIYIKGKGTFLYSAVSGP